MKKVISSIVAASFLFAGSAFAADVTNVEFSNGDVTVQGKAGESINGKVRVVVGVNEEVEFVQFDVISDNLAPVCVEVDRLQEGTHFVDIPSDVKFPPNTGTYDLQVKTSGIFGGLASIDCQTNVNETQTFNDAVRTVGGGSSVGTGSSVSSLLAMIQDLMKQIAELKNPPTPAKPAYCAALPAVSMKGMSGQYAVQNTLISNGFSIPAGATGYWGVQTDAAYFAAKAHCI